MSMKEIQYRDRSCDCCGSVDLEKVWDYTYNARTKNETYLWQVTNVICQHCGFAFVSPVPKQESLADYYANSFVSQQAEFYYSISKRVQLIRKYTPLRRRSLFVEVGSNNDTKFQEELTKVVEYHNVEINKSAEADSRSLTEILPNSVDIAALYFVLEHIPDLKNFLVQCSVVLKEHGILIIEVPDASLYDERNEGLVLWEHTNHFTPKTLEYVASLNGLQLLEAGHEACSRDFGFAAVFEKKTGPIEVQKPGAEEYRNTLSKMRAGVKKYEIRNEKLNEVRRKIAATAIAGKKVTLWGATSVCQDLLSGYELPESVSVVDSALQKKDFLSDKGVQVRLPQDAFAHIAETDLFVINTQDYKEDILNDIKKMTGRTLNESEYIVVK